MGNKWNIKCKSKKRSSTFLELESEISFGIICLQKMSAPNVWTDPIVRTGTYFVTKKPCSNVLMSAVLHIDMTFETMAMVPIFVAVKYCKTMCATSVWFQCFISITIIANWLNGSICSESAKNVMKCWPLRLHTSMYFLLQKTETNKYSLGIFTSVSSEERVLKLRVIHFVNCARRKSVKMFVVTCNGSL